MILGVAPLATLPLATQAISAAVVNYTLDIDLGTYTITGQTLELVAAAVLPVDTGAYVISGQSPELKATGLASGGHGGWDPHYYKTRKKKRKEPIAAFLGKIEAAPIEQAPAAVQAKAEDARIAAERFMADQTAQLRERALAKIEAFYEAIRTEIARREEEDEDEDEDDWLLLAA